MNKRGAINIELLAYVIGGCITATFATVNYVDARFLSKETAEAYRDSRNKEAIAFRSDINEVKSDIKEILRRLPKYER